MTNGEFHQFDPKRRIPVDLDDLGFIIMNQLFAEGETYVKELNELKVAETAKKRATTGATPAGKAKKGPTLREREPWG